MLYVDSFLFIFIRNGQPRSVLNVLGYCFELLTKSPFFTHTKIIMYLLYTPTRTTFILYKPTYVCSKLPHLGAVILLCHASRTSIGTVVIDYVYHDASPATLELYKLVFSSRNPLFGH